MSHLKIVQSKIGKPPKELLEYEQAIEQYPKELAYILNIFYDFYNGQDFSYMELESYQRFLGFELDRKEVDLIRDLFSAKKTFDFKRQEAMMKNKKGG